NFAPLENGLAQLERSSQHYDRAVQKVKLGQKPLDAVNRKLTQAERALTLPDGLPNRPWFRHQIYAPGLYTGYGVKTIPGVREAVDAGNYPRAAEQARIVIRALDRATATLQARGDR